MTWNQLLVASEERPPYILVGHSNGGLMIEAFTDLHPERVAGLVFLDAAIALPEDEIAKPADGQPRAEEHLSQHLAKIRRCLDWAEKGMVTAPGDECLNPKWYASIPPDLIRAEIANNSKPD